MRHDLTLAHHPVTGPSSTREPFLLAELSTLGDDEEDATMLGALPLRAPQADASRELVRAQRSVATRLSRLEELAVELAANAWAAPVAGAVLTRVAELEHLSDAIERVCADSRDWRVAAMLEDDAPLAEYIRGALAWTEGVVRALDALADGLASFAPDFALARRRLEDARTFHLAHLISLVASDACALGIDPASPEGRHLEDLFWATSWLDTTLTARFDCAA